MVKVGIPFEINGSVGTRWRSRRKKQVRYLFLALAAFTAVASFGYVGLSEQDPGYGTHSDYVWAPYGEGIPGSSRALHEMHIQQ